MHNPLLNFVNNYAGQSLQKKPHYQPQINKTIEVFLTKVLTLPISDRSAYQVLKTCSYQKDQTSSVSQRFHI